MKKVLAATAALVLGLTVAGAASAGSPKVVVAKPAHGNVHHSPAVVNHSPAVVHHNSSVVIKTAPKVYVGKSYHNDFGVRFNGGFYYRGYDHCHWEYRVWDLGCGRYHYYDPYVRCYYYWDVARDCYYPVGW